MKLWSVMKYPFAIQQESEFSLVLICTYCTSYCFSFFIITSLSKYNRLIFSQKWLSLWGCRDPRGSQTTLSLCKLCEELHKLYNQSCVYHSFFITIFSPPVFQESVSVCLFVYFFLFQILLYTYTGLNQRQIVTWQCEFHSIQLHCPFRERDRDSQRSVILALPAFDLCQSIFPIFLKLWIWAILRWFRTFNCVDDCVRLCQWRRCSKRSFWSFSSMCFKEPLYLH